MSSFEDDMKDVFEGAEFAPSEKVWAGIASTIAPKKKKGILFMWQTYGVAAGILLAATFGFLLNDGFFNDQGNPAVEQLTEESKENKLDSETNSDAASSDTLKTIAPKPEQLDKNTFADTNTPGLNGHPDNKDATKDGNLKNTLEKGNDLPLNLQAQRTDLNTKNEIDPIKPVGEKIDLSNVVADLKKKDEIVKPTNADLKASELLLDSKLNSALKSTTQAKVDPVESSNSVTDETQIKTSITADLSSTSENAMRIQSAVTPGRQKSVSGSLGNNVLNISSGLGEANSIQEMNLRDPNNLNLLSASVDNTEGEALGAISAGFGASFGVSKRLSLNLSFRYSEFKFRNTSNAYSVEDGRSLPIYIPVGYNPENVFFVGSYDVENTIQSIFLQTNIGYKIATLGKFDFSLQAGIGIDYFLAYKIKGALNFLETRKVKPGDSNFLAQTNLSGMTGLSVNYRLNPKLGLSADFTYRKFLSSIETSGSQPSSVIGFGLSLNYLLGKKEE